MHGKLIGMLALGMTLAAYAASASTEKPVDIYAGHGFWEHQPKITEVSPQDFVIMPWGWSPGDAEVLRDVKECGFNLAGFVTPENVKYARKAGLKCIVDDYRISRSVENPNITDEEISRIAHEAVAPLKGNPDIFGIYVKDEPSTWLFSKLAKWKEAIASEDPNTVVYMNILPIGAQDPGAKSYEDYVERFINTIQPKQVSYDHYTLFEDGSMSTSFYSNLEAMRNASMKHNIPFWNIILGNSHFSYANPTQGGINVQVFSTLAYGGKGICYFTYFAPFIGNYRNAAVDQFLHKTPTWDMIRLVNLQIHQLMPTYLKLKSVNVFHTPNIPAGCSGISTSKYISEISGGDFLIGEFEGPNGTPFVMVVNKNIKTSTGFSVKFKQDGKVMMTNPYTGLTAPFGGENGALAPGQGILLSLEK